jgi:hypothetical protein
LANLRALPFGVTVCALVLVSLGDSTFFANKRFVEWRKFAQGVEMSQGQVASVVFEKAQQVLGSLNSHPVRITPEDLWTSLQEVCDLNSLDRGGLIRALDAVFLVTRRFVLFRYVKAATQNLYEQAGFHGLTLNELWNRLEKQDLCPEHASVQDRLVQELGLIEVDRGKLVLRQLLVQRIEAELQTAGENGLTLSALQEKLQAAKINPAQRGTLGTLVKQIAVKPGSVWIHSSLAKPASPTRRGKMIHTNGVAAKIFASKGDGLNHLDRDEFLLALMEQDVQVPEGDDKALARILLDLGVVEVEGNLITPWTLVESEVDRVLREAGSDGIAKDAYETALQAVRAYPAYWPHRGKLIRERAEKRELDGTVIYFARGNAPTKVVKANPPDKGNGKHSANPPKSKTLSPNGVAGENEVVTYTFQLTGNDGAFVQVVDVDGKMDLTFPFPVQVTVSYLAPKRII